MYIFTVFDFQVSFCKYKFHSDPCIRKTRRTTLSAQCTATPSWAYSTKDTRYILAMVALQIKME